MPRTHSYKKRWPGKNLGELLNFLEDRHPDGISLKSLSAELGMTIGAISNIFIRDDLKLSKAEEIVRAYGYELHLFFPVRTYPVGFTPPQSDRSFENAGNIAGLAKYIYDSNWTINSVSKNMDIYPTVLTNAFTKGDILLSSLYKITDALGICFFWRFEKLEDKTKDN